MTGISRESTELTPIYSYLTIAESCGSSAENHRYFCGVVCAGLDYQLIENESVS